MKVFGIAGHSGMGKTTLLERLIPELRSRGLTVSLIKHSHKDIEIDRRGKDSYRLREAGCGEVMLLGNARWALMHELRAEAPPSLEYLLSRLQACDLVLIEGFKNGIYPKLEVWREGQKKAPPGSGWAGVIPAAGGGLVKGAGGPATPPGDVKAIADLVIQHARPFPASETGDTPQLDST